MNDFHESQTRRAKRNSAGPTLCGLAVTVALVWPGDASPAAEPDFTRDVRPVLASRCFKCHGPDAETREAGLRLDTSEGAQGETDSGTFAVVPGTPGKSELLTRVTSDDPDVRMPPPAEGEPLTAAQIELLRKWIEAGAEYDQHWSCVAPRRTTPPIVSNENWCRNAIDRFVHSRLDRERLAASAEADRSTLIRRLSLDLTGLPPTPQDVDAFVQDRGPDSYERLVDRLLCSPAFGERWARVWLDLARYADSAGYADDPPRVIWMYRDWVVAALNADAPFDQFTIEQIAGDMLPNPTEQQLIATAFHRNTMTNSEGGTDDEEFRNVAIVDRVNTTFEVWMATTIGCAQCHSHKYDPITQEEFYRVFAILNETADADRRDETPTLSVFTEQEQRRQAALTTRIAEVESKISARAEELRASPNSDDSPGTGAPSARYVRIELPGDEKFLSLAEVQVFAGEDNLALKGKATQSSTDYDGPAERAIDGNTDGHYTDARSTTHTEQSSDPWWEVDLGAAHAVDRIVVWNRTDSEGIGSRLNGFRLVLLDAERRGQWVHTVESAAPVDARYEVPDSFEAIPEDDRVALAEYRAGNSPELQQLRKQRDQLQAQLKSIQPVTTPIMRELPPEERRTTHIQIRGNFLDLGAEVQPGVPAAFHALKDGRTDRLALAQWLVDRDNPLTARVAVNRFWEQLFGRGLVATSEDFGTQGEPPSHPELLDWLAVEFTEEGPGGDPAAAWDVKALLRLIVTSATYRQSSDVTPERFERDPDNRLLARGPRLRLSAEGVRDQALFVSGLLSRKMEGPSVYPPRPKLGLTAAFGGSTDWDTSDGEDRHRRGLYTFWRRSIPYPSMDTFDAPSREVCTLRRIPTNTPLQALVTLNDPVFVEAAQALARRILHEGGETTMERAVFGFRTCVSRPPSSTESARLSEILDAARALYREQPDAAVTMATDPLGPLPADVEPVEAAAWTVVANVLLNLDETLTRR